MPGGCFHTMNLTQFQQAVGELHQRVAAGHGRVEIIGAECHAACVLISKAELDSLEQALEILSGTADFQAMSRMLQTVALDTAPVQATA